MPPKKEDKGNKFEYNKKYYQQNKYKILAKRRQQYKDSAKDIRATNKLAYNKNHVSQQIIASCIAM